MAMCTLANDLRNVGFYSFISDYDKGEAKY